MRFTVSDRPFRSLFTILFALLFLLVPFGAAQSKPQRVDPAAGNQKKNTRPTPMTEEERKKADEEKKRLEEEKNAIVDPNIEKIETNIVNLSVVVYNKKTGQITTGLKKENFAVFENGVKQNISNFSTPEAPITVTVVVEFSKWTQIFGSAAGGRYEPGTYEAIKPVAEFLTNFIKPPKDYASVIAFDLRSTPLTDFTNDPIRLRDTINLLLRNEPAFSENCLWDALKLSLVGGRADSVYLEHSDKELQDYSGMVSVKSPRKAIILVASGIDTFSKINYDDIRRIVQEAGVPIYIISTGHLFCLKYCDSSAMDPSRSLPGNPDRMTFLMAKNQMDVIAKESGGMHFELTFEAQARDYLQSINALLRSQYSLSYDLTEGHEPGKKYKLEVKVDVDGDGQYDDKAFVVQHRPFYTTPKPETAKPTDKKQK